MSTAPGDVAGCLAAALTACVSTPLVVSSVDSVLASVGLSEATVA